MLTAAAGLLAVAILVAGCGSDSGTEAAATGQPAEPLSKPEFVKQASQICSQGVKEKDEAVSAGLKELASQAKEAPSDQAVGKMIEESVLPSYSKIVDQLGQLGPPKGDEAKVKKLVAEYESALQSAEADPASAAKKNPFAAADEAAKTYGLEACRL